MRRSKANFHITKICAPYDLNKDELKIPKTFDNRTQKLRQLDETYDKAHKTMLKTNDFLFMR
nr:hypothetical protein [uncultured Campylobacter sp.]